MSTDATIPSSTPSDPQSLPADATELAQLVRQLIAREEQLTAALAESSETVSQQQQLLEKLAHELALLKRCLFGSRRERMGEDPNQKLLFDVSEESGEKAAEPAENEIESEAAQPQKRRGHGRRRLPQFLPRKQVEYTLPGAELDCPCCGTAREKISQVTSEQLEYTPASLFVIEHVQVTYACKSCSEHVVTAPKPPQPIDKGLPGPGLLAHVITAKYVQHQPLYRQEDGFARQGLLIRRSTLAGWMAATALTLAPLYELMRRRVLASHVLGTDDTPVKVLDPELDHTRIGRFWSYFGDDRHPYTTYDFTPSRKRDGPQKFLKDFEGILQADAFGGYDGIYLDSGGRILEAGCNAHARRKFFEARETAPEVAHQALAFYARLYQVEYAGAALTPDARLVLRQEKSVPILDDFKVWLNEQLRVLRPKSSVAGAIKYCLRNWEALILFTTDGAIPIDNNRTERTMRDPALGRSYAEFKIMRRSA